jgi:hypothetical protein
MAIKVFTAGERLFAADLNDNFAELVGDIATAGPAFSVAGSDTVNIDLSGDTIQTRTAGGDITFTASNYTAGKSGTVRIVPGGSERTLTFPADWKFVSFKPANVAANKVGILSVMAFGASAAETVAAWAVEG